MNSNQKASRYVCPLTLRHSIDLCRVYAGESIWALKQLQEISQPGTFRSPWKSFVFWPVQSGDHSFIRLLLTTWRRTSFLSSEGISSEPHRRTAWRHLTLAFSEGMAVTPEFRQVRSSVLFDCTSLKKPFVTEGLLCFVLHKTCLLHKHGKIR